MMLFWMLIGVMTVAAMLFFVWPLLRVSVTEKSAAWHSVKTLVVLVLLFPVCAIMLYQQWGSSALLDKWYQQKQAAATVQTLRTQMGSPQQIAAQLKQRLTRDPQSAQGWYLLGRLYASMQQFNDAVTAFATANQLQPTNENYKLEYAQALFFAHQHTLTPQAKQLITAVLNKNPQNPEALNLLALNAYQEKNYQTAIQVWEHLLSQYPADTPDGAALLRAIAAAQARLKPLSQQISLQPVRLSVQVKLAKMLQNQVQPDETVFVYARAVNGPPMPLAIARYQVKDLPITMVLDQSMAMSAQLTLASYPQVIVTARISKSGQAIPQTGDLEGDSGIINTKQQKNVVDILIRSVHQ